MGGGSYPSAEKQSVYSAAPVNWASFPKDISQKVNETAQLEFELAYYDFLVKHVCKYAMGTLVSSFQCSRMIYFWDLEYADYIPYIYLISPH